MYGGGGGGGGVIVDICKQIDAWNYELVDGYNDVCM